MRNNGDVKNDAKTEGIKNDVTNDVNDNDDKTEINNEFGISLDEVDVGLEEKRPTVNAIIHDYKETFDNKIGLVKDYKYKIRLKENAPIVNLNPYKIPHKFVAEINKHVQELENQDLIEPSMSPYNSPIVVVTKKTGGKRITLDLRRLNQHVIGQSYPLTALDALFTELNGAKIFTSLDLRSAYHHIQLDDDSKELTAFTIGGKKFQFKRLPFGLTSAPGVFQAVMSKTLGSLLGMVAYTFLDDILIYSKHIDKHEEDVRKVLDKLKQVNLHVKLSKCSFYKTEINYLGFTITGDGMKCNADKINEVKDIPKPKNAKQLQQVLGSFNFFRAFIPDIAKLAKPLYGLLRKDVTFEWSKECDDAFHKLKNNFFNLLAHPDYGKPFYLFTDASREGLGSCLLQYDNNNKLRPIGLFSRTLNKAEQNYSVTKLEMLAIHDSVKHFRYMITGYKVSILTDHKPLVGLFVKRHLPSDGAMARWMLYLSTFSLEFKYVKGKSNSVADFLSRLPGLNTGDISSFKSEDINVAEIDVAHCQQNDKVLTCNAGWSLDELIKAQEKDDFCVNIKNFLQTDRQKCDVKDIHSYLVIDNILYKKRYLESRQMYLFTIVVPDSVLDVAIKNAHIYCHGDSTHTLFKFRLHFYHPKEHQKIVKFCKHCLDCKRSKTGVMVKQKLFSADIPATPWHTVSVDTIGPFPVSESGNKYILIIADVMSRFIWLKAIARRDTETFIDFLRDIFNIMGYPTKFISDNALEFVSEAAQYFASCNNITKVTTTPYSPWSGSTHERVIGNVIPLLRIYCQNNTSIWDTHLSSIANELNNTLHGYLKDTPSWVMFQRDTGPIRVPDPSINYNYDSVTARTKFIENHVTKLRQYFRDNLKSAREKRVERENVKRKDRKFAVGDRVIIKNHHNEKIGMKYSSPGTIQKVHRTSVDVIIEGKEFKRINKNFAIVLD